MRTNEERIAELHNRAEKMRDKRDKTIVTALASASGVLMVCLAAFMYKIGGYGTGIANGEYAGSTLLSENTGGYILVAVLAFAAGACITFAMRRYHDIIARKKNHEELKKLKNKDIS